MDDLEIERFAYKWVLQQSGLLRTAQVLFADKSSACTERLFLVVEARLGYPMPMVQIPIKPAQDWAEPRPREQDREAEGFLSKEHWRYARLWIATQCSVLYLRSELSLVSPLILHGLILTNSSQLTEYSPILEAGAPTFSQPSNQALINSPSNHLDWLYPETRVISHKILYMCVGVAHIWGGYLRRP